MVVIRTILFLLSKVSIRSHKIFLFGAWFGRRYSDNPKYLLMEMLNSEKFSDKVFVWVSDDITQEENMDSRVKFVERNSLISFWYQLRSGSVFVSHGFQDIGSVNLLNGAIVYQLWHGFPVKHIGADDPQNKNEGCHLYETYQYFLADSDLMSKRIESAFVNYGATKKNIVKVSQPRCDYLRVNKDNETLKKEIKESLGIPQDVSVITYMPTFRDNTEKIFSFMQMQEASELKKVLVQTNSIILERQHFAASVESVKNNSNNRCWTLNESIDVQDVLLITDYLITDFSSVYIDFLVLNKPIIHFLYDGSYYLDSDRGLYANKFEDAAGPIVETLSELIEVLRKKHDYFEKYQNDIERRIKFEENCKMIDKVKE